MSPCVIELGYQMTCGAQSIEELADCLKLPGLLLKTVLRWIASKLATFGLLQAANLASLDKRVGPAICRYRRTLSWYRRRFSPESRKACPGRAKRSCGWVCACCYRRSAAVWVVCEEANWKADNAKTESFEEAQVLALEIVNGKADECRNRRRAVATVSIGTRTGRLLLASAFGSRAKSQFTSTQLPSKLDNQLKFWQLIFCI